MNINKNINSKHSFKYKYLGKIIYIKLINIIWIIKIQLFQGSFDFPSSYTNLPRGKGTPWSDHLLWSMRARRKRADIVRAKLIISVIYPAIFEHIRRHTLLTVHFQYFCSYVVETEPSNVLLIDLSHFMTHISQQWWLISPGPFAPVLCLSVLPSAWAIARCAACSGPRPLASQLLYHPCPFAAVYLPFVKLALSRTHFPRLCLTDNTSITFVQGPFVLCYPHCFNLQFSIMVTDQDHSIFLPSWHNMSNIHFCRDYHTNFEHRAKDYINKLLLVCVSFVHLHSSCSDVCVHVCKM